jgi:membrane fusion protein, copper/silver efflux system
LRPDMFVDVEFPLNLPPSICVPAEAVIDTGLRKSVFVDLGNGSFERRQVETGWSLDGRVEIKKGLMDGERIVVSGNFLMDSETRLAETASAFRSTPAAKRSDSETDTCTKGIDLVCDMPIEITEGTLSSEYQGKTFYFCSEECKQKFDKNPRQYLSKAAASEAGAHAAAGSRK